MIFRKSLEEKPPLSGRSRNSVERKSKSRNNSIAHTGTQVARESVNGSKYR